MSSTAVKSVTESYSSSQTYIPACNGSMVPICTIEPTNNHHSSFIVTFSPTETVTLTQPDGSSVTITYPCEGTKIEKCYVKPSKGHKQKSISGGSKPVRSNFGIVLCSFLLAVLLNCESLL